MTTSVNLVPNSEHYIFYVCLNIPNFHGKYLLHPHEILFEFFVESTHLCLQYRDLPSLFLFLLLYFNKLQQPLQYDLDWLFNPILAQDLVDY